VNLSAAFPILTKLADQIEGAGDEDRVLGRGFGEGVLEGAFGISDDGKMGGMVAGDFGELCGGNGARSIWRGENDFGGVGKEKAGDFVDSFVAKGGVNQPNFVDGEILLQEMGEFARRAGIVRAIEVNVRVGLQFFEAAGPNGFSHTTCDSIIRNLKAPVSEQTRRGGRVQGVLELESARQAGIDL